MKVFLIVVILLIVTLVAALLGAKNDQAVMFDYLLSVIELRLSLLLMLFFAAGALLSSLIFVLIWVKMKWQIGRLQKRQRQPSPESL